VIVIVLPPETEWDVMTAVDVAATLETVVATQAALSEEATAHEEAPIELVMVTPTWLV